jgi:pimeloyl-ACP methyl ester carboxylesterase
MAVKALNAMAPVQRVETPVLTVGYYDVGTGPAVVLLHGFPYDIHSYADVAPMLAAAGFRVIVPYLRGCGATRFCDATLPRTNEQAALASDIIELLDCLDLPQAVLAGFDWGARAACAAAALWPERCIGLVSAGGYVLHDLERATIPAAPERECGLWHQYYLATERGRAGLTANRRELARLLWRQWSPRWRFSAAEFERTAAAFDNPDWVEVALHNYRHKLGAAPGDSRYAEPARRLQGMPRIEVPTITLDGGAHGVIPPSDGSQWSACFRRHLAHRVVAGAGHNIPQEQPGAFAEAVLALIRPDSSFDIGP